MRARWPASCNHLFEIAPSLDCDWRSSGRDTLILAGSDVRNPLWIEPERGHRRLQPALEIPASSGSRDATSRSPAPTAGNARAGPSLTRSGSPKSCIANLGLSAYALDLCAVATSCCIGSSPHRPDEHSIPSKHGSLCLHLFLVAIISDQNRVIRCLVPQPNTSIHPLLGPIHCLLEFAEIRPILLDQSAEHLLGHRRAVCLHTGARVRCM